MVDRSLLSHARVIIPYSSTTPAGKITRYESRSFITVTLF